MKTYFFVLTLLCCIWISTAWAEVNSTYLEEGRANPALMPQAEAYGEKGPAEEESKR